MNRYSLPALEIYQNHVIRRLQLPWNMATSAQAANMLKAKGKVQSLRFSWEKAAKETLDVYYKVYNGDIR